MWQTSRGILYLVIFSIVQQVWSQDNRYFIYLSDKTASPYSIDAPEEFLSEASIARRESQGIVMTTEDLPVNPSYVSDINAGGAVVYYRSRWLNGVLASMDSMVLETISSMSFVDSIAWIGKPKETLSKSRSSIEIPTNFDPSPYSTAGSSLQTAMLNVDKMHEDGYRGEGITIAVLDGGFIGAQKFSPLSHVYENDRYLGGEDLTTYGDDPFKYSGHGTAVLSTIAAKSDSLIGTAFNANFLLYVTEDVASESPIEEYNWLVAAEMADSAGADILQSSVGYSVFNSPFKDYTQEDLDGETTLIAKAANYAYERGMIIVTSAGNEGNSSWRYVTAPADSRNVIAVGSVDDDYTKSGFSSVGPTADGRIKPDVVALGSRTTLMAGNGAIQQSSGTSYAAPLVAGLVAGLWQANPDWSNQDVINALKRTASRSLNPNNFYGHGVPNYEMAVLGNVLDVGDILSDKVTVYPNPFQGNKLFIDMSNQTLQEDVNVQIFDIEGSLVCDSIIKALGEEIVELKVEVRENGVYVMTLTSSSFFKKIKLIKE